MIQSCLSLSLPPAKSLIDQLDCRCRREKRLESEWQQAMIIVMMMMMRAKGHQRRWRVRNEAKGKEFFLSQTAIPLPQLPCGTHVPHRVSPVLPDCPPSLCLAVIVCTTALPAVTCCDDLTCGGEGSAETRMQRSRSVSLPLRSSQPCSRRVSGRVSL